MSSSAVRTRKLRNKFRDNEELYERTKDKEQKRQKAIHDQRKLERQNNEDKTAKHQEYEWKRKAEQQLKKKMLLMEGSFMASKDKGTMRRRKLKKSRCYR